jgi:predicted anti-sigma-YlaC factor YlaD
MNRCKFHSAAHRYVDGELSQQESMLLEIHLSGCDNCRTMVEELRKLNAIFERKQKAHPSPAVLARVRIEIDELGKEQKRETGSNAIFIMCRRLGTVAACMSIVLSGLIFFHLGIGTGNQAVRSGGHKISPAGTMADYYPFNILQDSDQSFINGDLSKMIEKLYEMPKAES